MAVSDLILALLRNGPAHGYTIKRDHDAWLPDARPLAFGQVYATLGRLERDGLVEVSDTRSEGGPDRTEYALTPAGRKRFVEWLAEPAPVGGGSSDEIVRKAVAAVRTGADFVDFLTCQRAAHMRRMRALGASPAEDAATRLARDHLVAHLDADLRWLDLAVERVAAAG